MIVLVENHDGVNVLHAIIGPETEFQFNLTGHSVMDLTDFMKNFKPGEPCMLVVNRCDSEEKVQRGIQFRQSKMRAMDVMAQYAAHFETKDDKPQNKDVPVKKSSSGLKCPKCLAPNSGVLLDGIVLPCPTCQKIDKAIEDKVVPPIPSIDKLDRLKKLTEDHIPAQKKSIFRFYKNLEIDPKNGPDDKEEKK